jgi:hypothetical protein
MRLGAHRDDTHETRADSERLGNNMKGLGAMRQPEYLGQAAAAVGWTAVRLRRLRQRRAAHAQESERVI